MEYNRYDEALNIKNTVAALTGGQFKAKYTQYGIFQKLLDDCTTKVNEREQLIKTKVGTGDLKRGRTWEGIIGILWLLVFISRKQK